MILDSDGVLQMWILGGYLKTSRNTIRRGNPRNHELLRTGIE